MTDMAATQTLNLGLLVTQLGGGLALFLFGMRLMTEALKTVAGSGMKNLLEKVPDLRVSEVDSSVSPLASSWVPMWVPPSRLKSLRSRSTSTAC